MTDPAIVECRAVIAHHSKSFALASRLLPPRCRDEAAVVYAWCRRADDAVDLAGPAEASSAIDQLVRELDGVYGGSPSEEPILRAFQVVVSQRQIPLYYPRELLAGLTMDLGVVRYASMDDLLHYSFRVAGTVGLMMCHVMGLRDARARRQAAHLGIAMQLTNICRDVREDWERGRLYLPEDYLAAAGAPGLGSRIGRPFPEDASGAVAAVVQRLLADADRAYRSGDAGLDALDTRCAFAIRTARLVYSRIGSEIAGRRYDVLRGRAWVGHGTKLALVVRAAVETLADRALRLGGARLPVQADFAAGLQPVAFPGDIIPI